MALLRMHHKKCAINIYIMTVTKSPKFL